MDRKLVTIRKIKSISPIQKADAIECAHVDGWECVVKKGEFAAEDKCVYFEIDSWVPQTVAHFMFKWNEYNGVKGERLRTVKMRGQLSQGLVMKVPESLQHLDVGSDVTDYFGVQKYEDTMLREGMKNNFPSFIIKTDQDRAQNILGDIDLAYNNKDIFECTIKLDGSSITVYYRDGYIGVCSRNREVYANSDPVGLMSTDCDDHFYVTAFKSKLIDALMQLKLNIAVQGELMGPKVQGNREKLDELTLFVFDIFDIDKQIHYSHHDRMKLMDKLYAHGFIGSHCPIISIGELPGADMKTLLSVADGKSLRHSVREGVVFKRIDGQFSFKVINNKFLLSEK